MERDKKPDLAGRVNGFDIGIFQQGLGIEISVGKEGQEVVLFRYAPPEKTQEEKQPLPATDSPAPVPSSAPTPEPTSQPQTETRTPVKLVGTVEAIEGMGETPQAGDPVFRFSVRWTNPKTNTDEVLQMAAFRHIAQTLNQFYTSPDPNIKLQPGRQISMMAWDHTATTGSYYPSQVKYLDFPTITNPKSPKRR